MRLSLTELRLPIMGSYESEFTVNRFGRDGNNPIPENGAVISFRSRIDKQLETELGSGKRGKMKSNSNQLFGTTQFKQLAAGYDL